MSSKPNSVYFGSGIVQLADGSQYPYTSSCYETRERLYEVRRFADGRLVFMVNSRHVTSLPDTPGARLAFEAALTMEGPVA